MQLDNCEKLCFDNKLIHSDQYVKCNYSLFVHLLFHKTCRQQPIDSLAISKVPPKLTITRPIVHLWGHCCCNYGMLHIYRQLTHFSNNIRPPVDHVAL